MEWGLNLNMVAHSAKSCLQTGLVLQGNKKKLKDVQIHTKKYTERYKLYTLVEKDHLGDWSPEKDCCLRLTFR